MKTKMMAVSIFFLGWVLTGCSSINSQKKLYTMAKQHHAIPRVITTDSFKIQTVSSARNKGLILRVYIEGDGHAWQGKRPSLDPSPRTFTLFSLMMADSFEEKAYIARPCQFVKSAACVSKWWTSRRYGQKMLNALNDALDAIKKEGEWKRLELVGYSGGATMALLLASRRADVISVRTIAGNLAPGFASRLHGYNPEPSALEPLDFKKRLEKIPQLHLVGAKDRVVPVKIVKYYLQHLNNQKCVRHKVVPGATHTKGWRKQWPDLLKEVPQCH